MKKNFNEAESPEKGYCALRFASIRKRCRYYDANTDDNDCRFIKLDGCGRNECTNPTAIKNSLRKQGELKSEA